MTIPHHNNTKQFIITVVLHNPRIMFACGVKFSGVNNYGVGGREAHGRGMYVLPTLDLGRSTSRGPAQNSDAHEPVNKNVTR